MINRITFTGRVGFVNAIRENNGSKLLSFTVGVNTDRKKPSGEYATMWYTVNKYFKNEKYWEKIAASVRKGAAVAVTGTLDFDLDTGNPKVFTRNDGTCSAKFTVRAEDVFIVGLPENKETVPAVKTQPQPASQMWTVDEEAFENFEDVPFA
ncbi:MAG: single-stranded DNA-binding protein [Anaerolineaceae bacterium]|nr:single-stranded DNA-binding protein [Anaerolineaceae bacterium]